MFLSVSVVVVGNPIDQFLIIGQCSNLLNVTNLFVTVLLVTVFALILNINYAALYSFFNSYNQLSSGTLAPVVGYSFYLYTVFTSICGYNLSGLIPYNLTVTSLALTTLFLGCQSFFGLNVVAFSINNAKLVGLFLPSGSPLLMSWFLVFLEVVSYNVRVLSLSIRLFANMLAGHALAKILGSFVWSIIGIGFFGYFFLIPMAALFTISFLELLICVLQGYVFSVLVSLYINDILQTH